MLFVHLKTSFLNPTVVLTCYRTPVPFILDIFPLVLLVEDDQVREYLSKLDIPKSMDPDGMYPRVLRELAGGETG